MTDAKANTAAARIEISVDGKDWRDISPPLQSLEIEDHDSLTDQAKLVLDDNTGLLANASFEGLLIRIGVGYGEKTPLIFEGVITAARIVTQAEGQKVEITAQDFSFRMSKHTPEERKWEKGQKLSEVSAGIRQRRDASMRAWRRRSTWTAMRRPESASRT